MAETNKPVGNAYAIIGETDEQTGEKALWIELGAVWKNRDGSFSFDMHAEPLAWRNPRERRRVQIRFTEEKEQRSRGNR
jgi:hypothetical protein